MGMREEGESWGETLHETIAIYLFPVPIVRPRHQFWFYSSLLNAASPRIHSAGVLREHHRSFTFEAVKTVINLLPFTRIVQGTERLALA